MATKAVLGSILSSCTTVVMEVSGATFVDEMDTRYLITSAVLVNVFPPWVRAGRVALGLCENGPHEVRKRLLDDCCLQS